MWARRRDFIAAQQIRAGRRSVFTAFLWMPPALKEAAKKRGRFVRDADDLVGGLAIELEIELGAGPAVVPVDEIPKLAAPERPPRAHGGSDREAHARRLARDAALSGDRFGGRDDAARDEALPALVLACEQEDGVARRDVLAAVHGLLRGEHEGPRARMVDRGLDGESHACPAPRTLHVHLFSGQPASKTSGPNVWGPTSSMPFGICSLSGFSR